jgi:hypothetical protein
VRRLLTSVALGAALVAAAGCGGGGSSTSSAADWASGYCSEADTWVTTLEQTRAGVKAGSATAEDAAQTVSGQTQSFSVAIEKLGTPDTTEGDTSAETAKQLADSLQGRIGRASAAIDTNNPDVTDAAKRKIVQNQVEASLEDVKTTTDTLSQADPQLGAAMKASPDCVKLNASLAAAG